MAGSVNKVILIGNLGSDPEVRHLDGGSAVARFNIATSESYNNKNGERVEHTEWHRIELWEGLAKVAEKYLRKGSQVYIEGRLRTDNWTDKEGAQRSGVTIRASTLTMLGSPANNDGSGYTRPAPAPVQAVNDPIPPTLAAADDDDDLPF